MLTCSRVRWPATPGASRALHTIWTSAWLATPEDVILHKLYWHTITPSERQLGDLAGVAAVQKGKLDEADLRRRAGEIGVSELVEQTIAGKLRPKTT